MIRRRLRSGIFLWIVSLILATTNAVHAAEYKPGTMGYLYEDCAKALALSPAPADFLNSYCGRFLEGYGMGVQAAYPGALPAPNPADPCAEDLKKQYARIERALCENLPDYRDPSTPPSTILQAAATIAAHWHERAEKIKKSSALKKPAVTGINTLITPGKFCDALVNDIAVRRPLAINPLLLKANWMDFVRGGAGTLAAKYDQCKKDMVEENFSLTPCGAEITGYVAGLYSTQHLQKRKTATGNCAKPVERLYAGLDMIKITCIKPDTKPQTIARLFLERVESLEQQNQNLGQPGFGAAGHQALYFGQLCRAAK